MGVKGLQTYMENYCPSACYKVNIRDLIVTYRRETGREPIIVVDGSSCLRHLYQGQISDWVLGGQLKEYVEQLKRFVTAFESQGAKLVFFFDGATVDRKRPIWIQRRIQNLQDVYKVFDCLNKWKRVSYVDQNLFQLPAGLGGISRFLFKDLCGCEVHTSIRECDEEIAEYARNKQCFAILGQDTDYIIYEGAQYYLSVKDLNLQAMTTLNYNRWALARQLHIHPSHLPLLATLVGNDVVSANDLKQFHIDICSTPGGQRYNQKSRIRFDILISSVASFIRTLPLGNNVFLVLPTIAHKVFRDARRVQLLDQSIRSYSTDVPHEIPAENKYNENWNRLMAIARRRHIRCEAPPQLWAIMNRGFYESSTALEDFREADLPPAALALRPLRQRIYGLLLREKPSVNDEPVVVTEWCMHGENSLNSPALVRPAILPGEPHPGLLTLWEKDSEEIRWRVFSIAISTWLDHSQLKLLPPRLVIPTAVLAYFHYELEQPALERWEIEALITVAVIMDEYDADSLSKMAVANVHVRAVRIATLYLRGCTTMQLLSAACGHPVSIAESMPSHFFDGKLFSSIYHKTKNGSKFVDLCMQKAPLIELHLKVQKLVFGRVNT